LAPLKPPPMSGDKVMIQAKGEPHEIRGIKKPRYMAGFLFVKNYFFL